MLINLYFFEMVAEIRHEEFLREARRARLVREIGGDRPHLWQRSIWKVGDLMISLGQRLKAGQNPILSETCQVGAVPQ